MSFWNRIFGQWTPWEDSSSVVDSTPSPVFNPATGLPMIGDSYGGVDVGGSPFGTSIHDSAYEPFTHSSGHDFD